MAIAAAVTAYARIIMIPFKIDPNTLYTDTDSAFTSSPINPILLGDQLGQMKDEMKGIIINEALFLGPKKYGYWYLDVNNNKIEKSVFAGVPRDSLSFNEIKSISNGNVVTKNVSNRFFKDFSNLNIDIKNTFITIKNSNDKTLLNNEYLPIVINNGYFDLFWKGVFEQLTKGPATQHLMLMCKVAFNTKTIETDYRILGHLRKSKLRR